MKRQDDDFPNSGADWCVLGFSVLLILQFLFGIAAEWAKFP